VISSKRVNRKPIRFPHRVSKKARVPLNTAGLGRARPD
jgi:hypothetical protein